MKIDIRDWYLSRLLSEVFRKYRVDNVRHASGYFFYRKLYNGGNCSTIWQNKTPFYTILTTNLYDKKKYPTELYGNNYIDNIKKAVVICLIIPTIFPVDAGSASTGNVVGIIRQITSAFWFKRKCCRND